jgi:molecular chaperone GrpE
MKNENKQAEEVNQNQETVTESVEKENLTQENTPQDNENAESANEIMKVKAELSESKDKYLRLYSEFENFRRRTAKERLELIQSANEQLLKALLPVVDDFDRAEKASKDNNNTSAEGFTLIQNKFKKILEQHGVKQMDIQKGADFNPDVHEAITQIPAPDESLKGKIVDVVEKGYSLNDKVIRYAKVVVGN